MAGSMPPESGTGMKSGALTAGLQKDGPVSILRIC